jgi:hypothetical protein
LFYNKKIKKWKKSYSSHKKLFLNMKLPITLSGIVIMMDGKPITLRIKINLIFNYNKKIKKIFIGEL